MSAQSPQLRLNIDYNTLVRLLGGDEAVTVELRNFVVQEFAKSHLKAVVNDPAFKKFIDELKEANRQDCANELAKYVTKKGAFDGVTLTYEGRRLIGQSVEEKVQELLKDQVANQVQARMLLMERQIEEAVAQQVDAGFAKAVADGVQKRIAAALKG